MAECRRRAETAEEKLAKALAELEILRNSPGAMSAELERENIELKAQLVTERQLSSASAAAALALGDAAIKAGPNGRTGPTQNGKS